MTTIMCTITLTSEFDLKNPNFQFTKVQAAASSFILIFCFIGMLQ